MPYKNKWRTEIIGMDSAGQEEAPRSFSLEDCFWEGILGILWGFYPEVAGWGGMKVSNRSFLEGSKLKLKRE